ncbi:MAG TPA: reverse transcriptase-like protein [Candidatus Acidoferrales bacterium]|nr:reverse transcriptase-like protein [Candidatus Acidoferrales bacterium]
MTRSTKSAPPSSARLFQESHAAPPTGVHVANIDGASRGNPGPAAYAVVLRQPDGAKIAEISKCIGRATNNIAEYYALIAALDYAAANSIQALRVRSDSELLVRQMQGRYKVKSAELKPLHERAQKLARGFHHFVVEHVPREQNSDADALANLALDSARHSSETKHTEREVRSEKPSVPLRIHAHYRDGAFIPTSRIELPEDSKVELEIRPLRHT